MNLSFLWQFLFIHDKNAVYRLPSSCCLFSSSFEPTNCVYTINEMCGYWGWHTKCARGTSLSPRPPSMVCSIILSVLCSHDDADGVANLPRVLHKIQFIGRLYVRRYISVWFIVQCACIMNALRLNRFSLCSVVRSFGCSVVGFVVNFFVLVLFVYIQSLGIVYWVNRAKNYLYREQKWNGSWNANIIMNECLLFWYIFLFNGLIVIHSFGMVGK